ncbi:MAG: cytochrome c-type biosis protein CcmE, partial [Solirubrobacteraceae bacterium]|nr:cytochrome c-type biosis protein CcmE [Solirubrobacteraceae bacterium]
VLKAKSLRRKASSSTAKATVSTIASAYTGTVPDPFREGREVIVTVDKHGGQFVGERDSLITKCPSKYKTAPAGEKQNY